MFKLWSGAPLEKNILGTGKASPVYVGCEQMQGGRGSDSEKWSQPAW